MKYKVFAVMGIVVLLGSMLVASASADVPTDTSELREAVTLENIMEHLVDLEAIGPHASDSPGYVTASAYVHDRLAAAGYDVRYQDFTFDLWQELSPPVLDQISPNLTIYPPYPTPPSDWGFATMEYSGAGDVEALVVHAVNFGCDASDFDGADFTDNIALILRGVCDFSVKAINAENAGANGVIVYNDEARHEVFYGTLGSEVVGIPVVGTSWSVGQDLLPGEDVIVHLSVDAEMRYGIPTRNVIAETPGGRDDRVVVVGAHLDTVAEGPGINDNGSGVATILEIAQQMHALGIEPSNKVVFAFWSAEEQGLLGAQYYVSQLGKRGIKNTALNLNFDMLASNNYALFVYDGDGSATPDAGPTGSANIEDIFLDYFASQELVTFPTAFDGRSDYGPFIDVGIAAGGLFAGGDGIKTAEQVAIYGGTADEFYDPYYHTPGDTLANINEDALNYMSDAVAHAVLTFAMTTSAVPGTAKASTKAMQAMEYKGPKAQQ
jgi:Zn-dependent M28 family amino/carboxypeptidase